jgi:hypothetical protein
MAAAERLRYEAARSSFSLRNAARFSGVNLLTPCMSDTSLDRQEALTTVPPQQDWDRGEREAFRDFRGQ